MRSPTGVARHAGNAAFAAATAAPTSAAPPAPLRPSDSPVAGLVSSSPPSVAAGCQTPPTNCITAVASITSLSISLTIPLQHNQASSIPYEAFSRTKPRTPSTSSRRRLIRHRREMDPLHNRLKSGVGPQRVPDPIGVEIYQGPRMLIAGPLQPFNCRRRIIQRRIH